MNKMKDKIQMISSLNEKKRLFDKVKHPFIIKVLDTLGIPQYNEARTEQAHSQRRPK